MAGLEKRKDFNLRDTLNKCQLGSREIYKSLAFEFPTGVIGLDEEQMMDFFNISYSTLRRHLIELREYGLIRRGGLDNYYMPFVVREALGKACE